MEERALLPVPRGARLWDMLSSVPLWIKSAEKKDYVIGSTRTATKGIYQFNIGIFRHGASVSLSKMIHPASRHSSKMRGREHIWKDWITASPRTMQGLLESERTLAPGA